jgi:hypothetical protein
MIGIGKSLFKSNVKVGGGASNDADAQAYFTANTAITSDADKNAINDFYLGLKTDGIYTKIKAMYLPIWGSATSSKWNLINPLDTDAAYRLTFSTGWTYASNGITPTVAYANTFFNPSVQLSLTSNHISSYIQTSRAAASSTPIGARVTGTISAINIFPRTTGDVFRHFNNINGYIDISSTETKGFFIGARNGGTTYYNAKNGVTNVGSAAATTAVNQNFWIGATASGPAGSPTALYNETARTSFYSIGDGLSTTNITNFNTRVNNLMTYFGINVY